MLRALPPGIRIGRLRAIFKVPERSEQALFGKHPPEHLAYVEWYSRIPAQSNAINGMYPISRSSDGGAIVEVIDIRRACQLIPKFGRMAVDRSLTSLTILDGYDHFFLNNRLDKDSYRSIYQQ